ncbi:hypothetical protein LYSIN_03122 [Lysinibacillus sphaericus]|uniref:DUF4181 domain-containing protein n=1 Tax=Lysinibacillus sphaericus TaxID=1421 RepID=A0A2S5D5R7_LYSSH|nr:hypothetical protein LYSIN_03122 [Lysinibacillus sphaericus]
MKFFKKITFIHPIRKYIHVILIIFMFFLVVPAGFNPLYLHLIMILFGLVILNRGFDYKGMNNKAFYKCLYMGIAMCLLFIVLFIVQFIKNG